MKYEPQVYIVGAGPGNPGLLTLRALECLQRADVVIHDRLIPEAVLRMIPPEKERIDISQFGPNHAARFGPACERMIAEAQAGKRVVRLKGGDPLVFGRGGEEAEILRSHGISYEIVPGITAAIGAASFTGIPLTHRWVASGAAIVTGHEDPVKPDITIDWSRLADFPGTIAVYMGLKRLAEIRDQLLAAGKPPETPAAAIEWGCTGRQRVLVSSLDRLPDEVRTAGFASPTLFFIGEVVRLRRAPGWFEELPLFGRRIVVTRPYAQAIDFAHRLETLGAVVSILPLIDIAPPEDWGPVDAAIRSLSDYDWLVFTSANGVEFFFRRLLELGRDVRALSSVRLAAIGPKTAESLLGFHLVADLIPESYRSEELATALAPHVQGAHVLLARADRGRDVLPNSLAEFANVKQVTVYRQVDLDATASPVLEELRTSGEFIVTCTSPSIARAFARLVDESLSARIRSGDVRLAAISPVTADELARLGFSADIVAETYTADGLIDATVSFCRKLSR